MSLTEGVVQVPTSPSGVNFDPPVQTQLCGLAPGGAKPDFGGVIDLTGSSVHCNDFHLHFDFPSVVSERENLPKIQISKSQSECRAQRIDQVLLGGREGLH